MRSLCGMSHPDGSAVLSTSCRNLGTFLTYYVLFAHASIVMCIHVLANVPFRFNMALPCITTAGTVDNQELQIDT